MQTQNNTVAVIGVGIMGSAIARNLIASGFAVRGFDTDPARLSELGAMGGVSAGSAAEAAREAVIRADQSAEYRGTGGDRREPCRRRRFRGQLVSNSARFRLRPNSRRMTS